MEALRVDRRAVRYEVKNQYGKLTFGSLRELRTLYQREFVSDDDLVRREGSERWTPAGLMPELKGSRALVVDHASRVWAAVGLTCAACFVVAVVKLHMSLALLWTVGLVAFTVAAGVAFLVLRGRKSRGGLARAGADEATSPASTDGARDGQGEDQGR